MAWRSLAAVSVLLLLVLLLLLPLAPIPFFLRNRDAFVSLGSRMALNNV
jgi:hypothetical protein